MGGKVGLEPTTNGSQSEVTVSYTTAFYLYDKRRKTKAGSTLPFGADGAVGGPDWTRTNNSFYEVTDFYTIALVFQIGFEPIMPFGVSF